MQGIFPSPRFWRWLRQRQKRGEGRWGVFMVLLRFRPYRHTRQLKLSLSEYVQPQKLRELLHNGRKNIAKTNQSAIRYDIMVEMFSKGKSKPCKGDIMKEQKLHAPFSRDYPIPFA